MLLLAGCSNSCWHFEHWGEKAACHTCRQQDTHHHHNYTQTQRWNQVQWGCVCIKLKCKYSLIYILASLMMSLIFTLIIIAQKTPGRSEEVSQSVWNGEERSMVHGMPLEESLPALHWLIFTLSLTNITGSSNISVWITDSLLTPSCAPSRTSFLEDSHNWVRVFLFCFFKYKAGELFCVLPITANSGTRFTLVKHCGRGTEVDRICISLCSTILKQDIYFFVLFQSRKNFWKILS